MRASRSNSATRRVLSDARLAADEHGDGFPAIGTIERRCQSRELLTPANEAGLDTRPHSDATKPRYAR